MTRIARPFTQPRTATAMLVAAVTCLLLPMPAEAVLIQTASGTGNTTPPADDPGWSSVGVRGTGNGVWLGDGWVLTVAHVGAGDIVLAGVTYAAEQGSAVQLTNGGASGRTAATDLMLYRLASGPVGLAAATIAATPPAIGTAVTMIGSGRDRAAFTEWTIDQSTTPWTWTQVTSGGNAAGYQTSSGRQMRWGTNTISADDLWVSASDLTPPLDVKSIATSFDALPGTSEAQAVLHDSGGAVFAKRGSAWELAGMIFDVGGFSGQPSPAVTAVFGNATYAVDLSHYRPQILAIVPEPNGGMTAAVVFAVMALALRSGIGSRLIR